MNAKKLMALVISMSFTAISLSVGWGGSGGHKAGTYVCPGTAHVTEIYGKASNVINALGMKCSDGTYLGPVGGSIYDDGAGTWFAKVSPEGFSAIKGRAGSGVDQIEPIKVGGTSMGLVGGDGGDAKTASGNGKKLRGFNSNTGGMVDYIEFNFGSGTTSATWGGTGGELGKDFTCPCGSYVAEIYGTHGNAIDLMYMRCNDSATGSDGQRGTVLGPIGWRHDGSCSSGQGGTPFSIKEEGGFKGITGSAGSVIDTITPIRFNQAGPLPADRIGSSTGGRAVRVDAKPSEKLIGFWGRGGCVIDKIGFHFDTILGPADCALINE